MAVVIGVLVVTGVGAWLAAGGLVRRTPVHLDAVSTSDGGYAFAPDPLVVSAHTPLTLTFRNDSDGPHTLIFLEPISVQSTAAVAPQGTTTIDFVAPTAGTYRFVCNVHEGMTGSLLVN